MSTYFELTRRRFLGGALAAGAAAACDLPAPADGAVPNTGWQIGCRTRPWAGYEYRVALDAIAEAGFKYIGFGGAKSKTGLVVGADTPIDEARRIGEETRSRGLEIPLIYGGDFRGHEGPARLRRIIDNCAACGAWSVLIAEAGNAQTWELYCQALAEGCDYAAEKQITLQLKAHGGLLATSSLCRKVIERVDRKNLTIVYDPGNICYYSDGEIDPVDDATAVAGLITGMLIKDYRHPKNVNVTPGTGEVRFPELMAQLIRGGFTHGPLIVETLAPGSLEEKLAEAKKAHRYVAELVGVS